MIQIDAKSPQNLRKTYPNDSRSTQDRCTILQKKSDFFQKNRRCFAKISMIFRIRKNIRPGKNCGLDALGCGVPSRKSESSTRPEDPPGNLLFHVGALLGEMAVKVRRLGKF